ncbi:MAG: hypothetical protein HOO67_06400 [Candidatus Peribacteraceae bacterium]|nr:hypothetical protein [Candidatus Peribacteraceae bacterium]
MALTLETVQQEGSTDTNAFYRVEVRANGKTIWRGFVYGHNRNNGWPELLRLIADEKERE